MKSNAHPIKKSKTATTEKSAAAYEFVYPDSMTPPPAKQNEPQYSMGFKEFVALMVLLMSLTALSIDAVLPMLGVLSKEMHIANANHAQYVISAMFLGLTLGQFIYGPLSDSYGRKNTIYIGMGLFCVGCLISLFSNNFEFLLLGRLLQGLGVAADRVVSVAIVRDRYSGREMARVMSIIMSAFIIVPAIAPSIGQLILMMGHWRHIFLALLSVAVIGVIWTRLRLQETLPHEKRRPFKLKTLWQGTCEVITHRITCGYTICAGLVFAGFMGYITSAQQIFQGYYDTGKLFPIYFSSLALAFGVSSVVNSRIVQRYGMQLISRYAFIGMIISSTIFVIICVLHPSIPFPLFMIYTVITFFCMGMLFGNINAIAMEPMGHIAGVAAAVIGTISSALSLLIGGLIGLSYDGSLLPLSLGFLATAGLGFVLQLWLEKSK